MVSRFLLLDVETIAAEGCEKWLPSVEADARLTDPVKIAADLAKKQTALLERAPLDADLNKIIAFGWRSSRGQDCVLATPTETAEKDCLELVWQYVAEGIPLVGYGLSWFDAGVLVRRSQLLGVDVPERFYEQGKYRHPLIIELADRLTLNGMIEQKKGRGLEYHCQRFGITVEDAHTGKDIAELWRMRDMGGILAHCGADLQRIRLLAQRLGVIPGEPVETPPLDVTQGVEIF